MTLPKGTGPNTAIRCSFQDRAGNLWFGTTGAGIYRYDGKHFANFAKKQGLTDDEVLRYHGKQSRHNLVCN